MRITRRGLIINAGTLFLVVFLLWFLYFRNTNPPLDATALARSETRMWQAYYQRDSTTLRNELSLMLHEQFGLSHYRTWRVSSRLTSASLQFALAARGMGTRDRAGLIEDIAFAYDGIKAARGMEFDPHVAAEAELDWWMARRRSGQKSVEQVGEKIEKLYAILFGATNDRIREAGILRAEAARVRDVSSDWTEVERLLEQSYRNLIAGIDQ